MNKLNERLTLIANLSVVVGIMGRGYHEGASAISFLLRQEPYVHPSCWRLIASFQILVMC